MIKTINNEILGKNLRFWGMRLTEQIGGGAFGAVYKAEIRK